MKQNENKKHYLLFTFPGIFLDSLDHLHPLLGVEVAELPVAAMNQESRKRMLIPLADVCSQLVPSNGLIIIERSDNWWIDSTQVYLGNCGHACTLNTTVSLDTTYSWAELWRASQVYILHGDLIFFPTSKFRT
jgi:hypothetical protein